MTYFDSAYTLEELEKFINYQPRLTKLHIYDCRDVEYLPDSIGNFTSLRELEICDCYSLKEIPDSIGKLTNLEKLRIRGC
ncbi:hypothetical protein [Nostoc edaphicum]